MFIVAVDSEAVEKRINKMLHRVVHVRRVEITKVLGDWQVQDMHRHLPGTKRGPGYARTLIRPHSLYEMRRSRKYGRQEERKAKRRKQYVMAQRYLHTSTRPILRAELLEALKTRCEALLKSIKW